MTDLKIGQVARLTGVGIEALRFYERESLLKKPSRNASGYRVYSPEAVQRVQFIRKAKELGFTLNEIRELLFLRVDDKASCLEIKEIAEQKITDIEEKLHSLGEMRDALQELVKTCRPGESAAECRILESLWLGEPLISLEKMRQEDES